jgi:carbon-monoxide dehydrogenase medium subunit
MEISFVAAAAFISLDASGKVEKARIAMGAVAPKPMRAKSAEAMLVGEALSPQLIEAAADAAAQATTPINDVRASAAYRRHLAKVLVKRTLEDCQQQLSE